MKSVLTRFNNNATMQLQDTKESIHVSKEETNEKETSIGSGCRIGRISDGPERMFRRHVKFGVRGGRSVFPGSRRRRGRRGRGSFG